MNVTPDIRPIVRELATISIELRRLRQVAALLVEILKRAQNAADAEREAELELDDLEGAERE